MEHKTATTSTGSQEEDTLVLNTPRGSTQAGSISAEEIVANRHGEVLIQHSLLKSDHFPGCQNKKLRPLVEGAPNFRGIDGLPVFGVAIPTVVGLRNVLAMLGAKNKKRRVTWINLREEPVVYVNGSPYVVRESDKPFANLEYSGIDSERVEEMESRLKADVLSEASIYDGSIMVAHEDDQFQVVEDWEPVTEVDVQTPAEVYEELLHDGYDVDYLRVPVTDEKAPMGNDFEILMKKSWEVEDGGAIIFNCQMGRGRTTTGMCIACMILLRKFQGHLSPPPMTPIDSLPKWWCFPEELDMASPKASKDDLKNGMFLSIRSMLRALENGRSAKLALDLILDACAAMQNLREAIATYRSRIFQEPNEMRRQSLLQVCLEYLDRYYSLIVFSAYLDDPGFAFGTTDHVPFSQWVTARPELLGILERLLRANPLSALAFDQLEGQELSARNSIDKMGVYANREQYFAEHIAQRSGSVLGSHTILKLDHFKGCQSSRLPEKFRGAPNFRGLSSPGIHVYGGAIATVEGIKEVLHSVGASPDDSSNNFAVWHMMREEPVIYINGEPFVLREASRPFKNLMEYRGIDAMRLDQMEQRLREDIIQESSQFNGEIIVTVEEKQPDGNTIVRDTSIKILDTSLVETPRQVLEKFQSEGYRVNFIRIPLTDGTCPKPKDFDLFYGAAAAARPNDALIYTCQLGGGRTTTGMCIGALLRMHLNGAEVPKMTQLERVATLERLDEDVGGLSPRFSTGDEIEAYELQGTFEETPRTASKMVGAPDIDPERVNMENGEYIGVRRFTRTLERGAEAKVEVDAVVDACGVLVNLRTAIMRYRKPKFVDTFFRPELQSRHSAFQRGSAYMERYCMLIAFSVYLHECRQKGRTLTFEDWLSTRTDITTAIDGIHQNPAGALAPVPVVPELSHTQTMTNNSDMEGFSDDDCHDISIIEARSILLRRRGHTLGKRTILKSYTIQGRAFGCHVPKNLLVEGITDIQGVEGLPIFTIGNATISGLRKFMQQIQALPGGHSHVIFTDLREELVVYVNGTAYMRREVEMAAAALHHAGIKAVKLEDLERRLRTDVVNESIAWGGKVLLHKELEGSSRVSRLSFELEKTFSISNFSRRAKGISQEDITKTTSYQTNTFVSAFWERTGDGGDIDSGIWTPAEVFLGLAAEGYNLEYKRVPMSRERTPQTEDLDHLYHQIAQKRKSEQIYHVFLSRTAHGSSARFAATFACACLTASNPRNKANLPDESPRMSLTRSDSEVFELSRSIESGEYRAIMNLLRALPRGGDAKNAVDEAIDRCKSIGSITKDILDCKMISTDDSDTLDPADSLFAKRLGLHYLKRYFYLIAFRAYLESANETTETFKDWVDARKEISYLASVLDLE